MRFASIMNMLTDLLNGAPIEESYAIGKLLEIISIPVDMEYTWTCFVLQPHAEVSLVIPE